MQHHRVGHFKVLDLEVQIVDWHRSKVPQIMATFMHLCLFSITPISCLFCSQLSIMRASAAVEINLPQLRTSASLPGMTSRKRREPFLKWNPGGRRWHVFFVGEKKRRIKVLIKKQNKKSHPSLPYTSLPTLITVIF